MPAIEADATVQPTTEDARALRQAITLALSFALLKLLLQVGVNAWQAHLGWGYFRDELYYLICGEHLDWGYVDHGPMVALQARAAVALFGKSLVGIRMFSALAGAAKLFLTGIVVWALGGRRTAQVLGMLGVLLAPEFLAIDSYLSMNSFEPVFWMSAVLAVLMLLRGGSERWWWLFGVAGGIGVENKPSMAVFLVAILIGLLLTPERRIVFTRGALIAVLLIVILGCPLLLWQMNHGWPTLEFLHNGKVEHKNVELSMFGFLSAQVRMLNPRALPLWLSGLIWLLVAPKARQWRFAGFAYIAFELLMHASGDAKDYYTTPMYPLLFAAGGMCWANLEQRRATRWLVPTYATLLAASAVIISPLVLPILSPQQWLVYTERTHLRGKNGNTERQRTSDFPQFFADRFGWQEEVNEVDRIYHSLSPADRAQAAIFCSNYGEASALNFIGADRGLPVAISGHNNYWLWGPHGATGQVIIAVIGDPPEELRQRFGSVAIAGRMQHRYAMPYENRNIYILRDPKPDSMVHWTAPDQWLREKKYI